MKRRLLSLALVLAMVLSLVPVGMVAADSEHVHCMCGLETTKDATCAECGTKAVAFTGITAMPSTPGNYYLTKDVAVAPTFLTSGEYSFCLCGHNLTSAAGKRIIDVAKAGTKLTITDCQETVGSVTGATGASATGSVLCVNSSGELNLYNAKISGNTAATNGVILVSGGTFNMYSGEISGNTSGRGAVYIDNTASVARFLGGKVTGNHSKNTGAMGGGAGVYGMKGTVELGGTAQIFGNTAAEASRNPDLYIRNDQGMKVQLSAAKPLENGAKIRYGLWTAEADTTNMKAITGAPTVWSSTWLRYNGTKVAYADGKFFLDNSTDHVHCLCGKTTIEDDVCPACGSKAVIWSATNTVPTTDGHFYLTDTVKTDKVEVKANAALCLHGKNLESKAGNTIIKTMPGYTFQLTDCNETVGAVTGVTATTAIEVQTNSTFVLWNGKITGNTGTGNGTVWVNTGTTSLPGGTFIMRGGEISGNTTGRGAVFGTIPSGGKKDAVLRLLGGTITGNTGKNTGGMGGGAGVYALAPVEIGGDLKIFGNSAAANADDLYLRNDGSFTGSLVLSTEVPLKSGAKVCYGLNTAETDTTNLKSITGTPANWESGWVSYEDSKVGYADGKFFLEKEHIHCLCGKETALNATCAACGTKAVKWTGTNVLPTKDQPGYYYLTEDVSTAEVNYANGGEFAICLHGKTLKSAAGSQILQVFQGATMHLTDCKTTGKITGVTGKTAYGSCMRVDKGGLLTMRNITITGNTAADEGIIYVDGSDNTAVAGGTFIMYSGSINGNTLRRGAVYGVSTGKNPPVIKILGGEITGNTGTGTGNRKAGAGVYSFFPVEVGGEAKIYGNTAKEGPADLYLRNDGSYTGKVVVSSEIPLTDGANIQYSLWTADADPTDLKMITGAPAAWNKAWVTYDGEAVDYADGKFFTKELPKHVHCLCGKELTLGNICASCGTEAKGWTGITEMPGKTASGYYYLENNIKTASFHAGGNFAFCLNGHDLISAEGNRVLVAEKNTTITITDCQPTCGKITGATGVSTYGSTLRASTGGKITMYNGKVTGNTNTGDGTVYAAEGTADVPGGVFTMYGGEISGNTAGRGAVFGALATAGKQPSVIRILGGTITGNTGLNTGGTGGGAGVYAMHPVEIGGDAKIYGNTAKKEPADMLLRNDQGAKLTVSAEKPLTDGANINYGLNNAEADPMNLIYITGAPTNWNMEWVKYDGVKVGYEAGRFYTKYALDYADHDHDGQKWISVTQENRQWPNGDGYYVLESDVKLEGLLAIAKDNHVHLCLNGHTLTAADNSAHFEVQTGGKLTICDCTAKTVDGKYVAGKIAGGTGKTGGSLRVRPGAEMTLIDGIFTENACAEGGNGGVVYADAGATIKMTGGMMCGNTGSMGGAIRLGAPNVGGPVPTLILEGGSICHNESINMGGGVYAAGGADIQLIGGTIANNTAAQGGGGIGVNSQGIDGTKLVAMPSTITLTGTTIADNEATTWGGNVYIKTGTVLNMQGGVITGGKSKVGAGILLESKDTTLNLSGGKINGNFGGAAGAAAVYASNNTIVNMTGGEVCNNVAEAGGGGIVLYAAKGTFTGGLIANNSAKGSGAGLCVQGSEVYLGKITISGNKTTGAAGGLYVSRAGDIKSNVTIDGTQILNNVSGSSGGGIFLYMNGNKITMLDGVIAGNQAKDGGGAVIQREVTFIMKNGTIKNNRSTSNGGGFYASIDSTFTMEGGTITGNYANVNGGGMYCLRSNVTLSGGTITGNQAKNSGGGVIFGGAKGKLCGTTISYNSCEGSGSGVMVLKSTGTVDGVKKTFEGYVTMTGGTVTGNTTKKAGAGVLVNGEGCHFTMYGGTISYNKADKFGAGIYIGKNGTLDMHGGTVCYNESIKDACGGVQLDGAIANITGGKIHHNKAARSAGGVLMGREGVVRMSNVEIYENSAKLGGGMVIQGKADLIAEGVKIYNNSSTTDAGGVYLGTYTHPTFKNSEFYDNTCTGNGGGFWSWATSTVKLEGCKFYGNTADGEGGGFWTRGDAVYMTDCVIEGNKAAGNGGGFGSGIMGAATPRETPGIVMKNCSVEKNISGGIGGGMFIASGAKCDMKDVQFVSNTAEAEGGAFWAKDELTVHDLTVNNNQSGGAGYAVYLDDSDYDGHSYVAGLMKFSGNVKVHDNQGGDLYLGEKTPIVIGEDGLGQDTLIHLVMHSGLLTDWVFGAYDYEGGDLEYTITYGDRSLTDPEQKEAPAEEKTENQQGQTKNESKGDTVLYIAVGAVALVVIALVAVLLGKKKKSAAAEKK